MSNQESFLLRTLRNSLAGTAGGVAVCLVGHPFDTLKVRLQTQPIRNPIYNGVIDCFLKTLKWEGVGGFYKGVGSTILGQMFLNAATIAAYYQISTWVAGPERQGHRLKTHEYFLVGFLTGGIASLAESPIDLFKTKMQIQIMRAKTGAEVQYRNVFQAGYDIMRKHRLRGTYQGLGGTLLRNIFANAAYFGFFEICRDLLTPQGGTVDDISVGGLFLAGGIAGFNYWFLTYPTDVIKSAMMSDSSIKSERRFSNILDCVIKLYNDEGGIRRFYRGFVPCIIRSVPANAVMLLTVEKARQYLPF